MRCKNCTGIGGTEYIVSVLEHVPVSQRTDYVLMNAERLRTEYCQTMCPVRKFEAKYRKPEEEPMFVGSRI